MRLKFCDISATEIIAIIDRVIEQSKIYEAIDRNEGICFISGLVACSISDHNNFLDIMHEYRATELISRDTEPLKFAYWWYDDKEKDFNSRVWYAPRYAFLARFRRAVIAEAMKLAIPTFVRWTGIAIENLTDADYAAILENILPNN